MGRRDAETETLIPITGVVFDVVYAIQAGALRENPASGPDGIGVQEGVSYTLEARSEVQAVAHALRGEGFDASEDGTGRGTPLVPVMVAPTMQAGGNATGGARPYGSTVDTCDSLVPICFDTTQITSAANYSNPAPGDACHPLAAGAHTPCIAFPAEMSGTQVARTENLSPALSVTHTTAIAFSCKDSGNDAQPELAPTLRSMGHDGSHANAGGQVAVAFNLRGREGGAMPEGPHDTAAVRAASGGSSRSYVAERWAVRRLTPAECEALQGFPRNWTAIPWRKKPAGECPDGPRYKAIGNSMAVNVMRHIGERIAAVDGLAAACADQWGTPGNLGQNTNQEQNQ